jgi:DNA uptake protein ComE-like DNA-binding protein
MASRTHPRRHALRAVVAALSLLWFPVSLAAQEPAAPAPTPAVLDINTASAEQLTTVVMSEEVAQRIIESRPYANKRQLVSRNLVSEEEYERIKDLIVARRVSTEP